MKRAVPLSFFRRSVKKEKSPLKPSGLTKYVPTDYLAGMTDKIVDLALKCGPNTSAGVLLDVRFNFQVME